MSKITILSQQNTDDSQNTEQRNGIKAIVDDIFSNISDGGTNLSDVSSEVFFFDHRDSSRVGKNTSQICIAFNGKEMKKKYMEGIRKKFSNAKIVSKLDIWKNNEGKSGNDNQVFLFATKEERESYKRE